MPAIEPREIFACPQCKEFHDWEYQALACCEAPVAPIYSCPACFEDYGEMALAQACCSKVEPLPAWRCLDCGRGHASREDAYWCCKDLGDYATALPQDLEAAGQGALPV